MNDLGKWAWLIGLALLVLMGLLGGLGVDLGIDILVSLALVLAFIGGVMHLAKGDRSAFFIATLALWAVTGAGNATGDWFGVSIIADLISGILGGATAAALAGAAGALVMTVYEWVMP